MVMPFHQRLAELYVVNKRRKLSEEEMLELQHCLAANVNYCWEMAYLKNLSLMASMTNDTDWLHEICAAIDNYPSKAGPKKKTPRKKRSDGADK